MIQNYATSAFSWSSQHKFWATIFLLFAVFYSLSDSIYSAAVLDRTYDEGKHFAWSKRLWKERNAERINTSYNSKTPITLINVAARKVAAVVGITHWKSQEFISRLATMPLFLALLLLVYWVCKRTAGWEAAYLATAAVALDPNMVANSSFITVDTAMAFAVVLCTASALMLWHRLTYSAAIYFGAALGFALSVKFSSVLLLALALILVPRALIYPRQEDIAQRCLRTLSITLIAATTASLVICFMYLFINIGEPLANIPFRSSLFQSIAASMPNLRLPLPSGFLTGIDICLHDERDKEWNVVLFGNWYGSGVWYYFLVLWLFKTPLTLLFVQALLLYQWLRHPLKSLSSDSWLWGFTFLVFLGYFSFLFRTQVGYRFILMLVPLAWITLTCSPGHVKNISHGFNFQTASKKFLWVLALMVTGTTIETIGFFGDPLTFSNLLIWPKHHAYKIIADSNIDWDQNHIRIGQYLRKEKITTRINPPHILPGHNTFQLNILTGVRWNFTQHQWLRENLEPDGHYLHTFLYYQISDKEFHQFITAERSYKALDIKSASTDNCWQQNYIDASRTEIDVPLAPQAHKKLSVCLRTPETINVVVMAPAGSAEVGIQHQDGHCEYLALNAEQQLWFRLQAGRHKLCVTPLSLGSLKIQAADEEVSTPM